MIIEKMNINNSVSLLHSILLIAGCDQKAEKLLNSENLFYKTRKGLLGLRDDFFTADWGNRYGENIETINSAIERNYYDYQEAYKKFCNVFQDCAILVCEGLKTINGKGEENA